jgi:DNA repair exonuclease SbcCD ATPase subunit
MVITVELENIGGFIGKHKFEFKEGLSEVIAPNAMGKTSLIKALLAMYIPNATSATELLNYDADEGYIKVEVGGKTFIRRFKRKGDKVIETESKPVTTDDRMKYIVLDSQLGEVVKRLVLETKPDITDYLVKVFRLEDYEKKRMELRSQIESLEKEREYLKRDIEELEKADEKRKVLEGEHAKLEKELEKVKGISVERVYEVERRIAELSRRLGEIDKRIEDLNEELIPTAEERKKELQLEVERLKIMINEFYESYREPDKYAENLKERIGQADNLINKLREELSGYISGQDARIPVIKMAMLTRATTCPICGTPVENPDEFWSSKLRATEEDVKRKKANIIRDYEERIARIDDERLNLWKELEEFQKKYNEIREIEAVKMPKYVTQLESFTKSLENYMKELIKLKNEKNDIVKELESLKKELSDEERKSAERRAEIERRLGEVEQQIRDLEEVIAEKSESGKKLIEINEKVEVLKKELKSMEEELYETLTEMKDEFAKIASKVIRELGFTWLKSIRLVSSEVRDAITGEVKRGFEVKVVRTLPSGKEIEQPLSTLSTSERLAVSLVTILTGYKLKIFKEYKGLAPILADEALLAFDPQRFEKIIEELKKYGKYVVITKLAEPDTTPKLTVVHKH